MNLTLFPVAFPAIQAMNSEQGTGVPDRGGEPARTSPLRAALAPDALRAALQPRRPVFRDPWDSAVDMGSSYLAVSVVGPLLLFCGAQVMSFVFGFDSRWPLGVYMAAGLVGGASFITIVGRERARLSVDLVAIGAWILLGLVVAPIVGLALPPAAALVGYGVLLVAILVGVRRFGQWEKSFLRTLSWPVTFSILAVFFAYTWHQLVFYV